MSNKAPKTLSQPKASRANEKVVAAYPSRYERSGRFMDSFTTLQHHDRNRRIDGIIPLPATLIADARNKIVRCFLDEHTADWLWFIDTDMVFEPDIVEKLVASAHPTDRPIMGALCFTVQEGFRAVPTIYVRRNDGQIGRAFEYPKGKKVRCWTGTGCLLIHRTVLKAMREAKKADGTARWPKPFEWFHDSVAGEAVVGEDIEFCLRATELGYPIYVDTAIKCGHEKPFVVDEEMYETQRAAGLREIPQLEHPTFVVIAAKNRHVMTYNLIDQLDENAHIILLDNGSDPPFEWKKFGDWRDAVIDGNGWGLHRMWNYGMDFAEKKARELGVDRWNVAILNNDLEVEPGFLAQLEFGIRGGDNNWISYPNHHGLNIPKGQAAVLVNESFAGQTMSGFAFMLRGETGLRLDEQFEFWYGDTDLQKQVEAAGKNVVCVGGCYVNHLEPTKSTFENPERLEQAKADEKRFAAKWGYDPKTLFFGRDEP